MSPVTSRPGTVRKTFSVMLNVWETHRIILEAADEAEAETIARTRWNDDPEAFSFKDGGIDGVHIEAAD